jgi:maltose/moltooligosaccharide transporter
MKQKPNLSFWQLWNLSVGYIGIQLGYSLQGQSSRIFSILGAEDRNLPILWLGAPLAGLLVQPLIGLSSDKTWTKLGRRIPFLLAGGIIALLAMIFMVNAELASALMPAYLFAAVMLLFMDCAFNVSMQPLRSLVGDMVNDKQLNQGFSIQMILSNIGAIVGFALPFIMTNVIGLSNESTAGGKIPSSLTWSYYVGGAVLLLSVLWTTFRVKEYPPKEFAEYNNLTEEDQKKESFFTTLKTIPRVMFQVAIVQFFTWFALFILWTYVVNGLAANIWHTADKGSALFNEAGNWWGVLGAVQSVCAVAFAIFMGKIANKVGRKRVYSFALLLGALGLVSMYFFHDKYMLIISMIGMGVATAGMNAMPFAIISAAIPAHKMGVYMGIFNISIVIPQIIFALVGGFVFNFVETIVGKDTSNISMIFVAGISMALAAMAVFFVKDKDIEDDDAVDDVSCKQNIMAH